MGGGTPRAPRPALVGWWHLPNSLTKASGLVCGGGLIAVWGI